MYLSGLNICSPRRPAKDIIDKTCLNSSDIGVARGFLISIGAEYDFVASGDGRGLEKVVNWMQVSLVSHAEEIDIKVEAEKP